MKIIGVSYSDAIGGAARAAYRIHLALNHIGANSTLYVNDSRTGDQSVKKMARRAEAITANIRPFLGMQVARVLKTRNPVMHSPAIFRSSWPSHVNNTDCDIVHLHWINNEMMSIGDIAALRKPIVWTLHDMWAFCGAEHVTEDYRWRDGYTRHNRPEHEAGFDLNKWVWKRKLKKWRPMHIVTPSNWLAECVRESELMRGWPVTVVPNTLDTNVWQPVDKTVARNLLGIPVDMPLIMFGSFGANSSPNKGFRHLRDALTHLGRYIEGLQIVIVGQSTPQMIDNLGFPAHVMGHLHDDLTLRIVYSAADAMIVPSRIESFGQSASEAIACGTPVVAFAATGLLDVVQHKKTGYLAKAYDPEDLANGIRWVLSDKKRHKMLCENARQDAVARFSYPVVAKEYMHIYSQAIS